MYKFKYSLNVEMTEILTIRANFFHYFVITWSHEDDFSVVQTRGNQMVPNLDCRMDGEPPPTQNFQLVPEFSCQYAALRCLDEKAHIVPHGEKKSSKKIVSQALQRPTQLLE